MPEAGPLQLRIYCICGQKMRVSADMFGRPGKCVACRQKIWIPTPAEIPPDISEIHLKDYPQFLRTPQDGAGIDAPFSQTPGEEEDAAEDGAAVVPLEELPSLRMLCSYDFKLRRRLSLLKSANTGAASDKAALMSYRSMVRAARDGLDSQMRDALNRTRDQITAVEEELARASLAIRAGEILLMTYLQLTLELRQQREWLVRRHHNLRGWLQVADPFLAGGLQDLPLEDVPIAPPRLELTTPAPREGALVNQVLEDLRQAMVEREAVPGPSRESRRGRTALAASAPAESIAVKEARTKKAAAAVAFCRSRVEQVVQDCESDAKALKAQLKRARERLEKNEVSRADYQALEMDLLRAQADNTRAHGLARRALLAKSALEVPRATSTFMMRLNRIATPAEGPRIDSWLAWACTGALLAAVFLPIIPSAPGNNLTVVPGLVLGLLLLSLFEATTAAIPGRKLRGGLLTALFTVGGIGILLYLYAVWYSDSSAGSAMRLNDFWFAGTGMGALAIAAVLAGTAAGISLAPFRRICLWPVAGAICIALTLAMVGTNFAGIFVVSAEISEPEFTLARSELGPYNTTLEIQNDGWRKFWLVDGQGRAPLPVRLYLERKNNAGVWEDAGPPLSARLRETAWMDPLLNNALHPMELGSNQEALLRYALLPGTYQLRLVPDSVERPLSRTFTVPPSMAISDEMRLPAGLRQDPQETLPTERRPTTQSFTLDLHGVIDGENHEPQFYISVVLPGSRPMTRYVALGEQIYGNWIAQEYHPQNKTLLISDGTNTLVIKPGEQKELETPPAAQ